MTMKHIVALLLLIVFYGCGENTVEPDGSNQPDPTGNGYAIVQITPDTLYQGETGWLRTNKAVHPSLLKLFVHTVPFDDSWFVGDTMFFIIPRGAISSRVRLFKEDTLAAGNFTLNVIPQHLPTLTTIVWTDSSKRGLPGDIVNFSGIGIPMRKGDVKVRISEKDQPIEYVDSNAIVVRLADGTTTGQMIVTTRGTEHRLSDYEVMQSGGTLLDTRVSSLLLKTMNVSAAGLMEFGKGEAFVLDNMSTHNHSVQFSTPIQHRGDSLIASEFWEDEMIYATFELRLKPSKNGNEVSGSVHYRSWQKMPTDSNGVEYTVAFERFRWYKQGNTYVLYATGSDIAEKISTFDYHEVLPGRTMEYTALIPSREGRIEIYVAE